jgi:8-oxo-dGTP pyrophosphatase MutT (NUDIX family)
VRYDLAAERLATLPAELPPAADILMPVVLGDGAIRLRGTAPPDRPGRPAAVLVVVYPDETGAARVVLTERATRDGHHSGEVSFPGGKAEPDDADLVATALREAAEEVALDPGPSELRIVGLLERVWIPVSDFEVTPVVALAGRRPILVPSPDEVARIVEAPLAAFLPGARVEIVERTIGDWSLRYGAYPIDGLSVWGATARVLSQLGAILEPPAGRHAEQGGSGTS